MPAVWWFHREEAAPATALEPCALITCDLYSQSATARSGLQRAAQIAKNQELDSRLSARLVSILSALQVVHHASGSTSATRRRRPGALTTKVWAKWEGVGDTAGTLHAPHAPHASP